MIYTEAVNYIHSLLKFGIRPGLSGMDALLHLLENPQKSMRFIHVAGTNGKGSVSTALSNILTDAGYKTGLYTSPYVSDFLERILRISVVAIAVITITIVVIVILVAATGIAVSNIGFVIGCNGGGCS